MAVIIRDPLTKEFVRVESLSGFVKTEVNTEPSPGGPMSATEDYISQRELANGTRVLRKIYAA
jgi:hypothetical protein